MYVIKNNLTGEYYAGEGFGTYFIQYVYFYDTFEDTKSELDDFNYYSIYEEEEALVNYFPRYKKDELSILKVTFKLEGVSK